MIRDATGPLVIEKALRLFKLIADDKGCTRVAVLARELNLSRSSLHRVLASLERHGMIVRLGGGYFDVGLDLIRLAHERSAAPILARISRPTLRLLAKDCAATAHLGILESDMVTYLIKETGRPRDAAAVFTRENQQLEAYCSGIGKVLLAELPPVARERYLAAGPFIALTQRTVTNPGSLRDLLEATSAAGFARDDGEIADHLSCLAVPVRNRAGQAVAAISLSFERNEAQAGREPDRLARLYAAAALIGARLGG